MDIREEVRESAELRYAAMDTLRAISDFIKNNKPSVLLEGATVAKGAEVIADEEKRAMWRDWINFTKDMFEKQKELPCLMIDDIANMYEKRRPVSGQQKGTSESK